MDELKLGFVWTGKLNILLTIQPDFVYSAIIIFSDIVYFIKIFYVMAKKTGNYFYKAWFKIMENL